MAIVPRVALRHRPIDNLIHALELWAQCAIKIANKLMTLLAAIIFIAEKSSKCETVSAITLIVI